MVAHVRAQDKVAGRQGIRIPIQFFDRYLAPTQRLDPAVARRVSSEEREVFWQICEHDAAGAERGTCEAGDARPASQFHDAFAGDEVCSDPRFEGPGMADAPTGEARLKDADDCAAAYEAGEISLVDAEAQEAEAAPAEETEIEAETEASAEVEADTAPAAEAAWQGKCVSLRVAQIASPSAHEL